MCDFSNLGRARVRYDARSVDMSKLGIAEGESSLTNEECSNPVCLLATAFWISRLANPGESMYPNTPSTLPTC
jgi:hypothetical protein